MSFINAAEAVQKQGQSLSDMQKLTLYGLFKQAKQGDCNTKRPGFFAMTDRAKWCVVSFLLYAMQVEGSPHTPTFVLLRRDVEAGAARRCSLVINGVPCRHFRPKVSSPSLFFLLYLPVVKAPARMSFATHSPRSTYRLACVSVLLPSPSSKLCTVLGSH